MSETSSIILTGAILPERNFDEVVAALARLLKVSEAHAAACLAGKETVVKRDVPQGDVEKYLRVLNQAGAGVRSEASASAVWPALTGGEEPAKKAPAVVPTPAVPVVPVAPAATAATAAPIAPAVPAALTLEPKDEAPEAPPTPVAPAPAAGETVVCPQCGHPQPKRTLCLACGCDMPRVQAARQESQPTNAFQAPQAMVVDYEEEEDFATPAVIGFSLTGRLGRLRYIAYSWVVLLAIAVAGILAAILAPRLGGTVFVPMAVVGIAALWMGLRMAVLRLHDLNRSGKWVLLLIVLAGLGGAMKSSALVAMVSGIYWLGTLVLMAWPGSKEHNDYGPPCGPNSTLVIVGAVLVLILQVVGVAISARDIGSGKTPSFGAAASAKGKSSKALDFSNPVYAEIRIVQPVGGRELEMVYLGKMANENECNQRAEEMMNTFMGGCKNCNAKSTECKSVLSPRYEAMFDNTPMAGVTYLSISAADVSEREGRLIFWGLTAAESRMVCQGMLERTNKRKKGVASCIQGEPS